jgi:hypothetical protein
VQIGKREEENVLPQSNITIWRFCLEIEGRLRRFVLLEKAKDVAVPILSFLAPYELEIAQSYLESNLFRLNLVLLAILVED